MKRRNCNRPSPFLGRMSQEAIKPGFSFFVFISCCCTFLLIGVCVLLLCWVLFFPCQAKRLAWGKGRLRNDLFCVGWDMKTLTSNQSAVDRVMNVEYSHMDLFVEGTEMVHVMPLRRTLASSP